MPEPLPAPSVRARLALFGILGLGLMLRIWTIGNGIPHTTGADEPEIMNRAIHMMKTGDFNPHFFDYGGLVIYLQLAVASICFATGAMAKQWSSLDQVWAGDFYLWARTVTALLGTLTIYVVYRAGLRWGQTAAFVAALIVAIHPHLVLNAHMALTDTPLTFLVALVLLVSMVAAEDGRVRWFWLAGLTVGLATATKYNGVLALVMPLAAAATGLAVRRRAAAAVAAVAGTVAGFLLGAPYSLLDLPGFLNGFASLAQHYNQGTSMNVIADQYVTHLRNAFGFGSGSFPRVGWLPLLLCLIGLFSWVNQARSRVRRPEALIALGFPLLYFWVIIHQSLVYARYLLPMWPMLCLALGVGVTVVRDWIVDRPEASRARNLIVAAILIVAIPATIQSVGSDVGRRRVSTDELTARWLQQNVPPEATIVIETSTIRLPDRFHVEYSPGLFHESVEQYRERGVDYLVGTSGREDVFFDDAKNYSDIVAAYNRLFKSTQLLKTFQSTDGKPDSKFMVLKIPR